MDKNQIKRGAVVAASAATILGLVFATPSFAASSKTSKASSSSSSSTTAPTFGDSDRGKGGHRGDHKGGPKGDDLRGGGITKTVTVNVPYDGRTYKLVVTDTTVRPAPTTGTSTTTTLPAPPKHTIVLDVTGTGSQTITINNLRPGTYSVELVAVSSSQTLTVDAPATTTPSTAPIVTPLVP